PFDEQRKRDVGLWARVGGSKMCRPSPQVNVTGSDRWQHVERLYHAALERDPGERTAFLRHACGGDETLRREVESLLGYANAARTFLDAPIELAAAAATRSEERTRALIGQRLGPYEIGSLLG